MSEIAKAVKRIGRMLDNIHRNVERVAAAYVETLDGLGGEFRAAMRKEHPRPILDVLEKIGRGKLVPEAFTLDPQKIEVLERYQPARQHQILTEGLPGLGRIQEASAAQFRAATSKPRKVPVKGHTRGKPAKPPAKAYAVDGSGTVFFRAGYRMTWAEDAKRLREAAEKGAIPHDVMQDVVEVFSSAVASVGV